MSLEGAIKDFGLSDIFQLIYVQQKSGVMSIVDGARRAHVGFVKGMVVSAQVENSEGGEGGERIGEVLVRARRITALQLEKALKVQQDSGDYIGQILVSQQAISESDLRKALRLQVQETTYRLFRWKDGRYSFEQRNVDYPAQYIDPISTEHILMEGVRRLDEWPPIEKKIPSPRVVFSQVPEKRGEIEQADQPAPVAAPKATGDEDPFADLDPEPEGRFTQNEVLVYHAVNGTYDVGRLIELLQIGEFEVCKALANLLSAGLIVPVAQPGGAAVASKPRGSLLSPEFSRRLWLGVGWVGNLTLLLASLGLPGWIAWNAVPGMGRAVQSDLVALKVMLQANHLRGLEELVEIWRVEHGELPVSIYGPLSEYGASTWPLKDPYGNSWGYDVETGRIGPDAVEATTPIPDDANNLTE